MATVQSLLKVAQSYIGVSEGTNTFNNLIAAYNSIRPIPMGYQVKLTDDWCDVFVTVVSDQAGMSDLIGRECGVQRHINIFKAKGIWLGRQFPKAGDIITFDWDGNGWADHIGFVEAVENNQVTTIEGNSQAKVKRNTFQWNDKRIMGYARPKYQVVGEVKKTIDELVQEVIAGKWGVGQARMAQLAAAGYDFNHVQSKVNQILVDKSQVSTEVVSEAALIYQGAQLSKTHLDKLLALSKQYQILPSLLIVMLHFEGVWGQSNVAKLDHNWGGMTWSASYVGNPDIKKAKGSPRPKSEGGYYLRYASVEDFFEDWIYLLRPGGIYKVSGQRNFKDAVKGLFQVGGSKYDYAALGYSKYLERMEARRVGVDKANPGVLKKLDADWFAGSEGNEKVIVSTDATTWQTGERIATWVKGKAFDVLETKEVMQKAFLLADNGTVLGWLLESDVLSA